MMTPPPDRARHTPKETPNRPDQRDLIAHRNNASIADCSRDATSSGSTTQSPVSVFPKDAAIFTVALDISTTFSSAAIDKRQGNDAIIFGIKHYKEDPNPAGEGYQIPTEIWYPPLEPPADKPANKRPLAPTEAETLLFGEQKDPYTSLSARVCPGFLHGYEVQEMMGNPECVKNGYEEKRRVVRIKTLLDGREHDRTLDAAASGNKDAGKLGVKLRKRDRNDILQAKRHLARVATLLEEEGRTTDPKVLGLLKAFLLVWFLHIKRELTEEHGLTETSPGTSTSSPNLPHVPG
jgi:hypothetical protein